ncbi:tannase/feruloyl esterase family alpha/beta hydrolase [Ramlibacter pallidus]|uniref:Tannase/feruloyl esterase family alpha/beta hydrolase n=1 Tax=Ramlibacter pallidus TaxID=2780087 RepID=A0ABR9S2W5_9BURK|nr:tannase/feruloyl esterase family alpha/beta hydrolase [Ramlibacter pallidus]MBE7367840.1 tannase/feruloyl esterase family alpha/beta hydrolase [Ramlibacter pallidus]
MKKTIRAAGAIAALGVLMAACGGGSDYAAAPAPAPAPAPAEPTLPQLTAAVGASLKGSCTDLAGFTHASTTITAATEIAAGTLTVAGQPIAAHCRVTGRMHERVSPVDGQTYAIGFEMRLPLAWNGRYYYQGNGGTDGSVSTATGGTAAGTSNALHKGFAVISSDAGHNGAQNPSFGMDPQARVDYGYGAVQKLTPMAKALIAAAYGKGPDRSYVGGGSNGGRHAMVTAARFAADYDGVLAVAPGFNLPLAAAAQLYTAQQFRKVATDPNNLATAFTQGERNLVAAAILGKCDALDGVADGLVNDVEACRTAFSLFNDVPTCPAARDDTCLTAAQKSAIDAMYYGPVNSRGTPLYTTQPYDPGLAASGWALWKFNFSVLLDPGAVGVIFQVPPDPTVPANARNFAYNYNFDLDFPKLFATNATYTENSLSFMTPPNPTKLDTLRDRGGKMIVVHGASDGVFSIDDTQRWYEALDRENGGKAAQFARFYRVPGMNHVSGGPATDQFDALQALVDWVEQGNTPDRIVAQARGAGNPAGVNAALPAGWAADRTRPLCPHPLVARYKGSGDIEKAENFTCAR